jgi:hypothetical protein
MIAPAADEADSENRGRWAAPRTVLVSCSMPLAIYVASRLAQVAMIAWLLPANSDGGVRGRLLSWDTGWFVRVARDGYPSGYTFDEVGNLTANGLAFFPAFPSLIRGVHWVTGVGFENSALIAGALTGALATLAVFALGDRLYGRRVGLVLATLFCAQPMSVVLSMGYSEGLFVACVAAALLAAHRDAWLLAGLAGLGACLTRPTGAALALALAAVAVWRFGSAPADGVPRWRVLTGTGLALVGVPAYLLWVGVRAGSLYAWFDIQTAGWGTTFDAGSSAWTFVLDTLRDGDEWVAVSVAWLLVATVLLCVLAVLQRVWWPLAGYGLLTVVLVVGQAGFYHSKIRLLVPALVILVPLAVPLARARTRVAVLVLLGYCLAGLWYGAHMITVWRFAI